MRRFGLASALAFLVAVLAVAIPAVRSQNTNPPETIVIEIDGSSTVFPITLAVAEDFYVDQDRTVRSHVDSSATGRGFERLCIGEIDIANAARPIDDLEQELCASHGVEYLQLPVAFDAIAAIVNARNERVSDLTVEELRKMWASDSRSRIEKWSQVRSGFPGSRFNLYGSLPGSPTFYQFNRAILGIGNRSRTDFTSSTDPNALIEAVKGDRNALAYVGLAYYLESPEDLKAVAIDGGSGPVVPSEATVNDKTYVPLSRPLFIYASKPAIRNKPKVKEFVEFYLDNAPELVREAQHIPMQPSDYASSKEKFLNWLQ